VGGTARLGSFVRPQFSAVAQNLPITIIIAEEIHSIHFEIYAVEKRLSFTK